MNGRPEIRYTVISRPTEKDCKKADVPNRFKQIWRMLTPGMQFTCREFCTTHKELLPKNSTTATSLVGRALSEAAKAGLIDKIEEGKLSDEFLNMRTVAFWLGQLRGSTRTNMSGTPSSTTRSAYARHLWHFNRWLTGKAHTLHVTEYSRMQEGGGTTPITTTGRQVVFKSVEDLVELLAEPMTVRADISIIVKQYLMDPIHKGKRAATMCSTRNAILSYFKQNEQRLEISFDPTTTYDNSEIVQMLTLQDVRDMLTIGGPTLTEKAVMLCKLHRGLDVSTLIDRFNFEAWGQIVRHFGHDSYDSWDLEMCPVPITLTRLKTGYTHLGFLERDAIVAIQEYLGWRLTNARRDMDGNQPLFLSNSLKPIGNGWMTNAFSRLAWKSGVQQKIGKNSWRVDSHEMRSLLKSTLIECDCRMDVADHVIGHKPKDSYEKQAILYGSSVRSEYAKASHMLNIFSRAHAGGDKDSKGNNDGNTATATATEASDVIDNDERIHTLLQRNNSENDDANNNNNNNNSGKSESEAPLLGVIARLASLNQKYLEEFQSTLSVVVETYNNNSKARGTCTAEGASSISQQQQQSNPTSRTLQHRDVMCCAGCGRVYGQNTGMHDPCPECGSHEKRIARVTEDDACSINGSACKSDSCCDAQVQ